MGSQVKVCCQTILFIKIRSTGLKPMCKATGSACYLLALAARTDSDTGQCVRHTVTQHWGWIAIDCHSVQSAQHATSDTADRQAGRKTHTTVTLAIWSSSTDRHWSYDISHIQSLFTHSYTYSLTARHPLRRSLSYHSDRCDTSTQTMTHAPVSVTFQLYQRHWRKTCEFKEHVLVI